MYQTLPFSKSLKTARYADIPWNDIATTPLKPFIDSEDRRENRQARRTLFEDLYDLLGTKVYGEPLKISLYLRPDQTDAGTAGLVYFKNKLMLPVVFQNSEAWTGWQQELAGDFDGTVVIKLTPSGQGATLARLFGKGDPYQNTGVWIGDGAPKDYTKAARENEKQTYLKPFINTKGPVYGPVYGAVYEGENAADLAGLFRQYQAQNQLRLNAPILDMNVYTAFNSAASFAYPKELQVMAGLGDGTLEGTRDFAGGYALLSARDVYTEWQNWKDIYEDWSLEDLTANNEADRQKTIGIYTTPYWVPFLSDGAGNFIAIDYAPNEAGTPGQIIAFGADAVKVRYIAKDMTEFFTLLLGGVDAVNIGFE